jgi:hypothetical protein
VEHVPAAAPRDAEPRVVRVTWGGWETAVQIKLNTEQLFSSVDS